MPLKRDGTDRLAYRWSIRQRLFLDQWLRWIREEMIRAKQTREWKGW